MLVIIIFFLAFGQTLYSQTQQVSDIPAISLSSHSAAVTQQPQVRGQEQQKKRVHTFGFGISTTDGDATTGKQSTMLSAFYSYALTPTLDLETSLQQMSMTKWYADFFVVSSALSHDINLMIKPFEFLPTFRVGIGSSARWQKSLISSSQSFYDPDTMQYFSRKTTIGQNNFAVGATLKLEYLIAIVPMLDISIRAQGHIYALPIIGENYHAPGSPGGAASLGIFFLIHP
jgi:hypothetical protein